MCFQVFIQTNLLEVKRACARSSVKSGDLSQWAVIRLAVDAYWWMRCERASRARTQVFVFVSPVSGSHKHCVKSVESGFKLVRWHCKTSNTMLLFIFNRKCIDVFFRVIRILWSCVCDLWECRGTRAANIICLRCYCPVWIGKEENNLLTKHGRRLQRRTDERTCFREWRRVDVRQTHNSNSDLIWMRN